MALCRVHDGEVGPGEIVEVVPARLTLGLELPLREHGAVSRRKPMCVEGNEFWEVTTRGN